MKLNKILPIAVLLLAILTLGAVSASDDLKSTDNLTADTNDNLEEIVFDDNVIGVDEYNGDDEALSLSDEGSDTLGYNGVDVYWNEGNIQFPQDDVVFFYSYNKDAVGDFKVCVDDKLVYNTTITQDNYTYEDFSYYYCSFSLNLTDLKITATGEYSISAFLNDTELLTRNFLVKDNPYPNVDIFCYNGNILFPQNRVVSFQSYDEGAVGDFEVYVDDKLVYNTTITQDNYTHDDFSDYYCFFSLNLTDLKINSVGFYTVSAYLNNYELFNDGVNIVENPYPQVSIYIYNNANIFLPDNNVLFFESYNIQAVGDFKIYIDGKLVYNATISEENYTDWDYCEFYLSLNDLKINAVGNYRISAYLNEYELLNNTIEIEENPYPGVYAEVDENPNFKDPDNYVIYFESSNQNAVGIFNVYVDGELVYDTIISDEDYEDEWYEFFLNLNDLKINTTGDYRISVTLNDYELSNQVTSVIDNPVLHVRVDLHNGNIHFPKETILEFYSFNSDVVGVVNVYVDGELVYNITITQDSYFDDEDYGYCASFDLNFNDLKISTAGDYKISITLDDNEISNKVISVLNHPYDQIYVNFYEEDIQFPERTIVEFNSYDQNAVGIFNVYVDGDLVYNTTITKANYYNDEYDRYCSVDISLNDLKINSSGEYNISVTLNGYTLREEKINISDSVSDLNLVVSVDDILVGQNATVKITTNNNFTGTIVISVNVTKYIYVTKGVGSCNVSGLGIGNYTVVARFDGNDRFNPATVTTNFEVKSKDSPKYDFNLVVSVDDVFVGQNTTVKVNTNATFTGDVIVSVDNQNYTVNVKDGVGSCNVSGLGAGNYTVVARFDGNDRFNPATKTTQFKVKSNTELPIDIIVPENVKTPEFSVKLPNDATGKLTVSINGKNYTGSLVNGSATINIPDLSDGDYNVIITYSGDNKYPASTKNTTVTIKTVKDPVYKIINNKDITMLYTAKTPYKVLITKDGKPVGAGETVTITYNGKTYSIKTDNNGYAILKLPDTTPKKDKYAITATYKGVTVKNMVKVNSIIQASNKNVKKSKKVTKVLVSLKKVNGKYINAKKLKIKFEGKTYTVKTNKKGVATWNVKKSMLKKLKVGKKYNYVVTYGKDTVTKKLTIKK